MKARSTGITVCGGFLIFLTVYLFATQPKDSITLFVCAWLGLSGVGLIAHKRAAFAAYLVGLLLFSIKVGIGAYSSYGDYVSAVIASGISLLAVGIPAPFIWARSEYLQPWFPQETAQGPEATVDEVEVPIAAGSMQESAE